jgi:hypothetical protein
MMAVGNLKQKKQQFMKIDRSLMFVNLMVISFCLQAMHGHCYPTPSFDWLSGVPWNVVPAYPEHSNVMAFR